MNKINESCVADCVLHRYITYHIWVVPMSRTSEGCELVLLGGVVVHNVSDRGPRVFNVRVVSPQVAGWHDETVVGLKYEGENDNNEA